MSTPLKLETADLEGTASALRELSHSTTQLSATLHNAWGQLDGGWHSYCREDADGYFHHVMTELKHMEDMLAQMGGALHGTAGLVALADEEAVKFFEWNTEQEGVDIDGDGKPDGVIPILPETGGVEEPPEEDDPFKDDPCNPLNPRRDIMCPGGIPLLNDQQPAVPVSSPDGKYELIPGPDGSFIIKSSASAKEQVLTLPKGEGIDSKAILAALIAALLALGASLAGAIEAAWHWLNSLLNPTHVEIRDLTPGEETHVDRVGKAENFLDKHPDLEKNADDQRRGIPPAPGEDHVKEAKEKIGMLEKSVRTLERALPTLNPEAKKKAEEAIAKGEEIIRKIREKLGL
jgi:hypothetical protein